MACVVQGSENYTFLNDSYLIIPSAERSRWEYLVCLSVCWRHGFRRWVCYEISMSNSMCMLFEATHSSLIVFRAVFLKMVAWWLYWILWHREFYLYFGFEYQLQTQWAYSLCLCVESIGFEWVVSDQKWPPSHNIRLSVSSVKMAAWRPYIYKYIWGGYVSERSFAFDYQNFTRTSSVLMGRKLSSLNDVSFKMTVLVVIFVYFCFWKGWVVLVDNIYFLVLSEEYPWDLIL